MYEHLYYIYKYKNFLFNSIINSKCFSYQYYMLQKIFKYNIYKIQSLIAKITVVEKQFSENETKESFID